MVQDGSPSNIAWQSFDQLIHVLLPGSEVWLNRRTWASSWRSNDDPGVGSYTFRVDDPKGGTSEFFVYKDGSVLVWQSGPYVGERLSGLPQMTESYIFNHTVYESPEEIYFGYTILNASIISHFIMDGESETFKGETWQESSRQWIKFFQVPEDSCDKYADCGAFGLCTSSSRTFLV